MIKKLIMIVLVLCSIGAFPVAYAHGGRTNASGCHTQKSTGSYHCHGAKSAKTTSRTTARTTARSASETPFYNSCYADIYNCSLFDSSSEAQKTYDYCFLKVGYDVHDLDRDKDSTACENN